MGNSCCSAQNTISDREITLKSKTLLPEYSKSQIQDNNSLCQIEPAQALSHYNNIRIDDETSFMKSVSILALDSEQDSSQQVIDFHTPRAKNLKEETGSKDNKNIKFLMMLQ